MFKEGFMYESKKEKKLALNLSLEVCENIITHFYSRQLRLMNLQFTIACSYNYYYYLLFITLFLKNVKISIRIIDF